MTVINLESAKVITILQNESWRKRREGNSENKIFGLLLGRDPFEFASISVSVSPPSSQPVLNPRKLPSVHRYAGNELNL